MSTNSVHIYDKAKFDRSIISGEKNKIEIHNYNNAQKKDEVLVALRELQTKLAQATDLAPSKAKRLEREVDVVIEAVDNSNPKNSKDIEKLTSMQKITNGLNGNLLSGIVLSEIVHQLFSMVTG